MNSLLARLKLGWALERAMRQKDQIWGCGVKGVVWVMWALGDHFSGKVHQCKELSKWCWSVAQIYVDCKAQTIVLLVDGFAAPFHINTIKNALKNDEGDFTYLRINFQTPGQLAGKKEDTVCSAQLHISELSKRALTIHHSHSRTPTQLSFGLLRIVQQTAIDSTPSLNRSPT